MEQQPEQTIIPEVKEILEKDKKVPEQVVITIDFSAIDDVIQRLQKAKTVVLHDASGSYYVDGVQFTNKFLSETMGKFSQYINSVSNMMFLAKSATILEQSKRVRALKVAETNLNKVEESIKEASEATQSQQPTEAVPKEPNNI